MRFIMHYCHFVKMCVSCVYLLMQRFCLGKSVSTLSTVSTGFNPFGSQWKIHTHWSTNLHMTQKPSTPYWGEKKNQFSCICALVSFISKRTKVEVGEKTLTTTKLSSKLLFCYQFFSAVGGWGDIFGWWKTSLMPISSESTRVNNSAL